MPPRDNVPSALLRKLEDLALHHERRAAAIRGAIAAVSGRADRKQKTSGATFRAALAIDAARRGHAPSAGRGRPRKHPKRDIPARKATAEYLRHFSTDEPRPAPAGLSRGLGALIRHGYLKQKGNGIVRTAKAFTP